MVVKDGLVRKDCSNTLRWASGSWSSDGSFRSVRDLASSPSMAVVSEAGYASMVELEKLPRGFIEATLYNRLLDMARHRFCLTVTLDGEPVRFSEYILLEDTYLYLLENKKLDVSKRLWMPERSKRV